MVVEWFIVFEWLGTRGFLGYGIYSVIIGIVLGKLGWWISLFKRIRILRMSFVNCFGVFWNCFFDFVSFKGINVYVFSVEGGIGYFTECMVSSYLNYYL